MATETESWSVVLWYGDVTLEDHADTAIDRLIDHFKEKPRIEILVRGFVGILQSLEDLAIDLLARRALDTAEGEQLDGLGEIVVELRGTKDDPLYRVFLAAAILANRCHGRPAQLLEIVGILPVELADWKEERPAAVRMTLVDNAYALDLFRLLSRCVGGGIRFLYRFSEHPSSEVFSCSGVYGASSRSTSKGCSSPYVTPKTGGHICGGFLR